MKASFKILTLIIVLSSLLSSSSTSKTIHVPGDSSTIQGGINGAHDADTVLVADGTYTGSGNSHLDFSGKAITVRSENGWNNCIIDLQNVGLGFNFHSGETAASVVEGFIIKNGAGIRCYESNPTIKNCVITGNIKQDGGGIWGWWSSPTITNCTIAQNHTDAASGLGGGIYFFHGNPIITNCTITGNIAGYGGGIWCAYTDLTIINCTFTENWAIYHIGGAVDLSTAGSLTITNSILWGDTFAGATEISAPTGLSSVTYCDVEGGYAGEGNINTDPLFVDPDGPDDDPDTWEDNDYHLLAGSPCTDAGDNTAVPPDLTMDLDGNPRIADGDANGTTIVDMGVYERLACLVSPQWLDFGMFCIDGGYNYVEKSFTITNAITDTLRGSVTESCDHYSIVSGGGSYNIAPGESLVVTVRFEPDSAGQHLCMIETGSAVCSDVSCMGVGDTTCRISSVLWADSVCVGGFIESTFTITNAGADTFSGNITLSLGQRYSIISGGGLYTLAPGESRMVTVRFTPGLGGGNWDKLETGYHLCCDMFCYCSGLFCCYVWPDELSFGTVNVGDFLDKTFYICNNGPDTLSGDVTESCEHYTIVSGGGGYTLGPGDYKMVTVRFAPVTSGTHTCTIETGSPFCIDDVWCTGTGHYCGPALCGDCNNNGSIDIIDIIYFINYLFRNGPEPVPGACVGDVSGDGQVTLSDVVYLITYVLKSGPPPVDGCCDS